MTDGWRLRIRERWLAAGFIIILACFIARLFQLQSVQHDQWAAIAKRQTVELTEEKPPRGEIRDRNDLPMAVTLPLAYAVGFRPTEGINRDELADRLSDILPMSATTLRKKMESRQFIYLARRVDWQIKQHLESLDLKCLQFDREQRRSYPAEMTGSTVIGFTNLDGIGMEGIERSLNDVLSGESYQTTKWHDARRLSPAVLSNDSTISAGANASLTIDLQLQTIVDRALSAGVADLEFERTCAILMDPWTGDILALSTLPTYDPNRPGDFEASERRCWPVTDVYEPGSTFKMIPVSIALDLNKVSRSTLINCERGSYRVPGATLHDAHPYDVLSVDDVVAKSSNIGAAKIAEKVTANEFYDRIRAFGFGNSTGIDIAGEQSGVVPTPSHWSGPTRSNLAMGHGISCTALQLASAYCAIANGGVLMKPRIVKNVVYPNGNRIEYPPEMIRRVMPATTAAQLTDMLVRAVEVGTGTPAKIDSVHIAGKTGTAQKVDHVNKTYFQKRFVSSFVGYFPADNPRYLLLVVVDDPIGKYFGATVAAPIFKEVAQELLAVRLDDSKDGDPLRRTKSEKSRRESANVALASSTQPVNFCVQLADYDGQMIQMPPVEGYSLRMAAQELSRLGLKFEMNGSGIIAVQYPPAGSQIPVGFQCTLWSVESELPMDTTVSDSTK